jgi:F-type H+-transporting ATPase subunit delta
VIGIVLARRYAKAVIDLAQEADILKEVGKDLDRIAALFADSHELVNVFADPTIAPGAKEKVLSEVLEKGGVQELTMKFIHVVLGKGRILGIGEIAQAYREFLDQIENRVRARVVSAAPLSKKEESGISDALSKISGKEITLEVEVDESLLGGVVAYIGSQVYDGSIKNQLTQIKDNLSKGR